MTNLTADLPISKELLDILRCPQAVQEKEKYGDDPGKLELVHNSWLVSADSGLKYPIRDGIPVMLIDEGAKWKNTSVADLPVPPPAQAPAAAASSSSSSLPAKSSKKKYLMMGVAMMAVLFVVRKFLK